MYPLGTVIDIVPAIIPLDLQTARDGDWVSLKNAQGVAIVVFKGAGTDGDDPTFSFQQATDVSGTGAKDLSVITTIHRKQGTLTSVGTWTTITQAAAASYAPGDPSAQSEGLYVFQIEGDQLDADNDFDCVRVRCSDVGTNAQLGCALYLLYGLRHAAAPANLLTAIAD